MPRSPAAAQVATGNPTYVLIQEGHQRPSAAPRSGMHLQDRVVLAHRIREAMRSDDFMRMGGDGKTVEADETYIGRRVTSRSTRAY